MGTRLYAEVATVRERELLAGVPEGTGVRLKELEEVYEKSCNECKAHADRYPIEEAFYDAVFADYHLECLRNFETFGYGKVYSAHHNPQHDYISITDPEAIRDCLEVDAGVSIPEGVTITRLYWC